MPEAMIEKETCGKCGVDVRENTSFCYNCGARVSSEEPVEEISESSNGKPETAEVDAETRAALDDLAEKFRIDPEEDHRLAKAAEERRKARVRQRKSAQYTWEPDEGGRNLLLIAITAVIVFFAGMIVLLTVYWK